MIGRIPILVFIVFLLIIGFSLVEGSRHLLLTTDFKNQRNKNNIFYESF